MYMILSLSWNGTGYITMVTGLLVEETVNPENTPPLLQVPFSLFHIQPVGFESRL